MIVSTVVQGVFRLGDIYEFVAKTPKGCGNEAYFTHKVQETPGYVFVGGMWCVLPAQEEVLLSI